MMWRATAAVRDCSLVRGAYSSRAEKTALFTVHDGVAEGGAQ